MNIFKEAVSKQIRIQSNKGLLNVEQLFTLSINDLNDLAVQLDEQYEKSNKKSFLTKTSAKDKIAKLKFDLVYEILTDKLQEAEELANASAIKEHNNKIISLIAEKQDESLKGKTIKQLEAMLK